MNTMPPFIIDVRVALGCDVEKSICYMFDNS